jgi:hypothetical protein
MSKMKGWFMSFRRGIGSPFAEAVALGPWLIRLRSIIYYINRDGDDWEGGVGGVIVKQELTRGTSTCHTQHRPATRY